MLLVTKKEKAGGMSTPEIIEALEKIEAERQIIVAHGEDEKAIDAVLSTLSAKAEEKITAAAHVATDLEGAVESIAREIKRLQELKSSYTKNSDRVRSYLKYAMGSIGALKISSDIVSVTYSETVDGSVDVYDEMQIPLTYRNEKITYTIDKIAISEALKRGEDVPGARLRKVERLIIK